MDAAASHALAQLPKDEAGKPGRALENFQPGVSEATVSVAEHRPHQPQFPKRENATLANLERARRTIRSIARAPNGISAAVKDGNGAKMSEATEQENCG